MVLLIYLIWCAFRISSKIRVFSAWYTFNFVVVAVVLVVDDHRQFFINIAVCKSSPPSPLSLYPPLAEKETRFCSTLGFKSSHFTYYFCSIFNFIHVQYDIRCLRVLCWLFLFPLGRFIWFLVATVSIIFIIYQLFIWIDAYDANKKIWRQRRKNLQKTLVMMETTRREGEAFLLPCEHNMIGIMYVMRRVII